MGAAFVQFELEEVSGAVAGSQGNKPVDLIGIQSPEKTIDSLQGWTGKVPFRLGVLIGDNLKTVAFQVREPGEHFDALRGRRRSEHSQALTGSQRLGLSGSPVVSRHS